MPILGVLASAITGNLGLSVDYLVVAGGGGGGDMWWRWCRRLRSQ
jgi:hypothetical protein